MHEHPAVFNQTRGAALAARLERATTWWGRARGLLGRRELPAGEALLIDPCNSVHCFLMAFPIDVIYIDRDQRVVALARNLKPNRIGPIVPRARAVLELPAGVIEQTGTQIGDQLALG
jgi:uncharacterized membrane protein (UPF0127 family)